MILTIASDADELILPGGPDIQARDVWGVLDAGLDEMWGGVAMRAEEADDPASDGALWPGVIRAGVRYLTVRFAHRSNSTFMAEWEVRDRIADLLGRSLTVTLDGPLGVREVTGFIKSAPEFTHMRDGRTCTCSVIINCPDPFWYGRVVTVSGSWGMSTSGDVIVGGLEYPLGDGTGLLEYTNTGTSGRVTAPNGGRRPSWPTLFVEDPISWARFSSGGRVVEFKHQASGLAIDCRAGTASSAGTDLSAWLTRDDFFQIPPGGAQVSFRSTPPARFTVETRPAWL